MSTRVSVEFGPPKMLIGGELVESASGETFASHNPANGEFLAEIPRGNEDDITAAVEAANAGFEVWSNDFSVRERAKRLFELASLLEDQADHLGAIDAADSGNPYASMRRDPEIAAEFIDVLAGSALEMKGEVIPVSQDTLDYTLEQPYGVVGRIIAYNHPLLFAAIRITAPLIAGNAVVLKPPEQDSISALEMGRVISENDVFPDGVLNIVTGFGDEVGSPLISHDEVRKIGFTGSVETGRKIQQQAGQDVTDVLLELGGKNPCIVFPDADIETAIDAAATGSKFTRCQGQSCASISRLFLHESQYDEGIELLKDRIERIELGDPLRTDTDMGCLVSEQQYERVLTYIDRAKDEGATLLVGGSQPDQPEFEDGYFVEPTVFGDVTMDMEIAQEEVFGPVLSVFKWSDEAAVIADANAVEYGLTASVFTEDLSTAHRVAEQLEAGYIWINQAGRHYVGAPFGGWKQSGIGREGYTGEILEYTQTKNVNIHYDD